MSTERPSPPPSYIDVQGPRNPPSYTDLNLQPAVVGQPPRLPEQQQSLQSPPVYFIPENPSPVDSRRNPTSQSVSFTHGTSSLDIGTRRNLPSYSEVLEAEGTGRFPLVGRRARRVIQLYRRDNDDWTSNSDNSCCKISSLTVVITLICLFSVPISLTMGILGVVHENDCPVDKSIPEFMACSGFLFTAVIVLSLMALKLFRDSDGNCVLCCVLTMLFFASIIFIAFQMWGSFTVLIIYKDFSKVDKFCHTATFLYAFSFLILFWLLFPLACGFCICYTVKYFSSN